MTEGPAPPFEVRDCALITLAVGRSASDLRELRDGVAAAPAESLYHHFLHALLRPSFDDPEYRNDFALWARRQIHDPHLAERLGVIDPMDFPDIELLRQHLVEVMEDRLHETILVPSARPGHDFHFLCSRMVVFSTGLTASTPDRLAAMVPRLSTGSIFFHFVEARRRPSRRDDFSAWLEPWGARTEQARRRLAGIDVSLWTLTEMRDLVAAALGPASRGGGAP